MQKFKTVDDYIAAQEPEAQKKLEQLREIVKDLAPKAEEKLSYGMPYFSLNGRLCYLGAFKDHVSLFPASRGVIEHFAKYLAKYKTSAGTVQFPLGQPLPIGLIRKIIKFRIAENLAKSA